MSDEYTQPGCEVPTDEYQRFKEFVREERGKVRGNLGRELANAMAEYRQKERGSDQLTRIEDDLASLKAIMADADADGGHVEANLSPPSALPDDETPARTDRGSRMDKPAANQPRGQKVDWIVQEIRDDYPEHISRSDLRDEINDAWGFQEDTVDEYVDLVVSGLEAQSDPRHDHGKVLLWGDRLDDALDEHRDRLQREADDEFNQMTD